MTKVVFVQGAGPGAHAEDPALASSLAEHLGDGYEVAFPELPDEGDPSPESWLPAIAEAIADADGVVGHSLGGYFVLKHLAEERALPPVRAIAILAAPFPGGDADWVFDGFELPPDFGSRLPGVPTYLYASPDDEVVPYAHRALYASAMPGAVERDTTGGHQLGGDLSLVATDLRAALES